MCRARGRQATTCRSRQTQADEASIFTAREEREEKKKKKKKKKGEE